MMSARGTTTARTLSGLGACAALLVTVGCSAESELDPTGQTSSPTASVSPSAPSPSALGPDVLLAIDSTLTAADGAELAVSVRVNRSLEEDDDLAAELQALVLSECGGGFLRADRLDDEDWGLVRVDVTATQVGDTAWPTDAAIDLVTSGQEGTGQAALASSDPLLTVPTDASGEVGPCLLPRTIAAPGPAYYVLGIQYDFSGDDLEGVFWNGYRFGVSTVLSGEPIDAEITSCTVTKTPLGEAQAAPEVGYAVTDDADECSAGMPHIT